MTKRKFQNRLNDLDSKKWLKFQKSWFIHNPPPRRKDVLRHPAKFPESLAQEFIEFFTKKGQVVLDPMVGTGSTQIAALRSGRHSYGIELNPKYAEISRQIIDEERKNLFETVEHLAARPLPQPARLSLARVGAGILRVRRLGAHPRHRGARLVGHARLVHALVQLPRRP